jgi:hypothetical protein
MAGSSQCRDVGTTSYRGPVSNIAADPVVQVCASRPEAGPVRELLPARAAPLGESTVVRRLLPTVGRRMAAPPRQAGADIPVVDHSMMIADWGS